MIKKIMLFVGAVTFALLCLFSYLSYLFWNPSDVHSGTVAFYFKIPAVIKNVELLKPITKPLYGISSSDGEKVGSTDLYYDSEVSTASLVRKLTGSGAECKEFQGDIFVCDFPLNNGYKRQTTLTTNERSVSIQETIIGDM